MKRGFTQHSECSTSLPQYFKRKLVSAGFTLIELMVVIVILGVLVTMVSGSFVASQRKARDSKRKSDVAQIARSMEMYYNDFSQYPSAVQGLIMGCGAGGVEKCEWGSSVLGNTTPNPDVIYMVQLPRDPSTGTDYCFASSNQAFQLYARLENTQDPDYVAGGYTCNSETDYTYGIASPNSTP